MVRNFSDPDHETRFFVGNPQTAGRGLTLVSANTVIYYSNDFNLESRTQSEDRCHRIGQEQPVTYIDLLAEGTVDEHIVRTLQNKIALAGAARRDATMAKGKVMDTKKFKSIALPIEAYEDS